MQRSIEVWVSQAAGQITPVIRLWAECYPLPVGEMAARRLYAESGQRYPDELTGLLPFRQGQEAYWGLRAVEGCSTLDMFGLKGWAPPADDAEEYLWFGALAYSLHGHDDTSLLSLVEHGTTWWRDFSSERVQGRPRGSGRWQSREHLEREVIRAGRKLLADGSEVKQEAVAVLLDPTDVDGRKLRSSLNRERLKWPDVKKRI